MIGNREAGRGELARDASTTTADEVALKCDRLAVLARESGVKGILLTLQPNFAWLTAGRTNRVDGSREAGAGALLVTASGRRAVVANAIEAPRLAAEAVADLGFDVIEYPWTDERAEPALPYRLAADAAGGRIGTDGSFPDALPLDGPISRLRAPLMPPEIERYRRLGADLGRVIAAAARTIAPGVSEQEAAGCLAAALAGAGLRPVVLLVAADQRIARFRHPVPTSTRWEKTLLLATCSERGGLIGAASRIITAGSPDRELVARTEATARVGAALLDATRQGATGATIFQRVTAAYAECGYPGEERLHHQGGPIGYRARDWVAHPTSRDVVTAPQAFAWNPTITGTKIEETFLAHGDGRVELLTGSPDWPGIEVTAGQTRVTLPGLLAR